MEGKMPEAVQYQNPKDFRHLCDICATSVCDIHRSCLTCADSDFRVCIHCCKDSLSAEQVVRQDSQLVVQELCSAYFSLS